MRSSPEVRMTKSTSGSPRVSSAPAMLVSEIAAGGIPPARPRAASARTARVSSSRPP